MAFPTDPSTVKGRPLSSAIDEVLSSIDSLMTLVIQQTSAGQVNLPDSFFEQLLDLSDICMYEIRPLLETEEARVWFSRTRQFLLDMQSYAVDGYDAKYGMLHTFYCEFVAAQKAVGIY